MIQERIQPRVALRSLGLSTLREICRAADASVSGTKEELVERIVAHFAEGKDQRMEEEPTPPKHEPRRLSQSQFETLFSALLHQELSDILRRLPELRQTGTKELRIKTLWDAHLSEVTLLSELMNRQLEDLLHRLGLRLGGSKDARIERLIDHFSSFDERLATCSSTEHSVRQDAGRNEVFSAEIVENQALFRQKSSNPSASLQPWLEQLLEGNGLIRCYATEDANPTKQLKNKLSQAAAAHDGLLVLLLADESSFLKAREALVGRWMMNAEWPKSVATVALAFPPASPAIHAVVERVGSRWPALIRTLLFPEVEVVQAIGSSAADVGGPRASCSACSTDLPLAARFCPGCGTQLSVAQ
jgi:hypothetical protein